MRPFREELADEDLLESAQIGVQSIEEDEKNILVKFSKIFGNMRPSYSISKSGSFVTFQKTNQWTCPSKSHDLIIFLKMPNVSVSNIWHFDVKELARHVGSRENVAIFYSFPMKLIKNFRMCEWNSLLFKSQMKRIKLKNWIWVDDADDAQICVRARSRRRFISHAEFERQRAARVCSHQQTYFHLTQRNRIIRLVSYSFHRLDDSGPFEF